VTLSCSKCILTAFVVASMVAFSQGYSIKNAFDEPIYKAIYVALVARYPDDPQLAKCISDDFRGSKIADKFYTIELLTNQEKLQKEIEPHVNAAEIKCKIGLFAQSTLGIFVLIAILLVLILISCCIIKCLCC